MLTVHHGNRLEALSAALARILSEPAGEALELDTVVIPNPGMGRWLALELARHLGVSAGIRFVSPRVFFWELLRAVVSDLPRESPFEPGVLAWRLYGFLARIDGDPALDPLRRYLASGACRQRWELAQVLATTFDRYLVHRPDVLLRWEKGDPDDDWQALLWRRVVSGTDGRHRARLAGMLLDALHREDARTALPRRLAVFGLPTMAAADVEILGAIATRIPVNVFLLNPCGEYAGDVQSRKVIARLAACDEVAAAALTEGNPLLASMGRQPLELFDRLLAFDPQLEDCSDAPADGTLLGAIQADIFRLRTRGTGDFPRTPLAAGDRSLVLHACHSPMREAEVLYDHLLDLFASDPTLEPGDVVVMATDVATYARCLQAICAAQPEERRLRISVADLGLRAERPLIEAFLGLLELPATRLEVDRVLGLLELDPVRRRFALGEEDLERVRSWLREARVCWGTDATSRAALGFPATAEHTWRFGLDRLLLGYAMPDVDGVTTEGLTPVAGIEGSEARAIGGLVAFGEAVMALPQELAGARTPAQWARVLSALFERFCDPGPEEEDAARAVREALFALETQAARGGMADEPIPLEVVRAVLAAALETRASSGTFLAGAITVCAPVPMRSIPFKVVCLLGMDVSSFPRADRLPSFDLLARQRRRGDPSRREDDRTLFLEALLSARQRLHISWTGRSLRDDTEIPPSVLVSELLEYIERGFDPPQGCPSVRAHVLVEHRLQAFSRVYFEPSPDKPGGYFSYRTDLCEALRQRSGGLRAPRPILESRLAEAEPGRRVVTPRDLAAAVENPARTLLRERLGIRLPADDELPTPREPLVLEGLEDYRLRSVVLESILRGHDLESLRTRLRGQGLLPHGVAGDVILERARQAVAPVARQVAPLLAPFTSLPLQSQIGEFLLAGTVDRLGPSGRVVYRPGDLRPVDRLRLWVSHLALQLAALPPERRTSWLVGRDATVTLRPLPPPEAASILATLLGVYWEALHRLVPLFPAASCACAAAGSGGEGLRKARQAYEGSSWARGDAGDPWVAYAWRGSDPLGEEFAELARAVWLPLLAEERSP